MLHSFLYLPHPIKGGTCMFIEMLEERKNGKARQARDLLLAVELYEQWRKKGKDRINPIFSELEPYVPLLKAYQQLDKHTEVAADIIKKKVEEFIHELNTYAILQQALQLDKQEEG